MFVGHKRMKSLMKFETDAELFESIILTLLEGSNESSTTIIDPTDAKPVKLHRWFECLSEIESFSLMIRFINNEIKAKICAILQENGNDISIISKYA